MASELKINTGDVISKIEEITNSIAKFSAARKSVISTIDNISGEWRGKAEEKFVEAFKEFDDEYNDMENILMDYLGVAKTFCQSMDDTEKKYKNKINSI